MTDDNEDENDCQSVRASQIVPHHRAMHANNGGTAYSDIDGIRRPSTYAAEGNIRLTMTLYVFFPVPVFGPKLSGVITGEDAQEWQPENPRLVSLLAKVGKFCGRPEPTSRNPRTL